MEINELTPEQIEKQISALGDSVYVINDEIAKAEDSDEAKDRIRRNYQHLEIMLGKDYIQSSGTELFNVVDAVAKAKSYLGE